MFVYFGDNVIFKDLIADFNTMRLYFETATADSDKVKREKLSYLKNSLNALLTFASKESAEWIEENEAQINSEREFILDISSRLTVLTPSKKEQGFLNYLRDIPLLRLLPQIDDYFEHKIAKNSDNKRKEWINAMLITFSAMNRKRCHLTTESEFSAVDLTTLNADELELYEMMKTYDEKYYFNFDIYTEDELELLELAELSVEVKKSSTLVCDSNINLNAFKELKKREKNFIAAILQFDDKLENQHEENLLAEVEDLEMLMHKAGLSFSDDFFFAKDIFLGLAKITQHKKSLALRCDAYSTPKQHALTPLLKEAALKEKTINLETVGVIEANTHSKPILHQAETKCSREATANNLTRRKNNQLSIAL